MTRSARRSWRRRAAAGFSANTPSATAMRTPAWCSTRWRGSRKPSPRRSSRRPTTDWPRRWPRSARCGRRGRGRRHRGRRRPCARGTPGAGPQGRPDHQGNRAGGGGKSAPTAGFAICSIPRSAPSKAPANRSRRPTPLAALERRVRSDQGADRGVRRPRDARPRRPPNAAVRPGAAQSSRRRRRCRPRSAADDTEAAMNLRPKPPWRRPQAADATAEAVEVTAEAIDAVADLPADAPMRR